MKLQLQFDNEEKAKKQMERSIDEDLLSYSILDRLARLRPTADVVDEHGESVYRTILLSEITKPIVREKNNGLSYDIDEKAGDLRDRFIELNKRFGISKELLCKNLLINDKYSVCAIDHDFLYNFFNDTEPLKDGQKKQRGVSMDDVYVQNVVWRAEGLYKVHLHMARDNETITKIKNAIIENSHFPYMKERLRVIELTEYVEKKLMTLIMEESMDEFVKYKKLDYLINDICDVLEKDY